MGTVTGNTLAELGEGGRREVVLPLEQNTGWADILADKLVSRMSTDNNITSANNGQPIEVVVKIGDSTFARQTIDSINKEQRKQGKILLDL